MKDKIKKLTAKHLILRVCANYYSLIKDWGIQDGTEIAWQDFTGRLYYFILFHVWGGVINTSGYVHGRRYITIGKNFNAGKCLRIEAIKTVAHAAPQIIIKDNVSVSDYNHIGAVNYIEIGNNVLFGSKCYITDHNHGIYSGNMQSYPSVPPALRVLTLDKKVIIEDNVWLGDNVVILPGITIGKGSIIGANAVVAKSIPPYSIAVGVPARVIKHWSTLNHRWESV